MLELIKLSMDAWELDVQITADADKLHDGFLK
jgi:hypothetical protein